MSDLGDKIKFQPNAYWFGISYESDMAYAKRILRPKKRKEFIEAVNKAWMTSLSRG